MHAWIYPNSSSIYKKNVSLKGTTALEFVFWTIFVLKSVKNGYYEESKVLEVGKKNDGERKKPLKGRIPREYILDTKVVMLFYYNSTKLIASGLVCTRLHNDFYFIFYFQFYSLWSKF